MGIEDGAQVVRRYLDAVGELDHEALTATFHPQVVMLLPFAPEGIPQEISGKDAVSEAMSGMFSLVTPLNFRDYRISGLEGEPTYLATYTSDSTIRSTGLPYRNNYISWFTVQDGLISRFAEYFDPMVFAKAMGATVQMPG